MDTIQYGCYVLNNICYMLENVWNSCDRSVFVLLYLPRQDVYVSIQVSQVDSKSVKKKVPSRPRLLAQLG